MLKQIALVGLFALSPIEVPTVGSDAHAASWTEPTSCYTRTTTEDDGTHWNCPIDSHPFYNPHADPGYQEHYENIEEENDMVGCQNAQVLSLVGVATVTAGGVTANGVAVLIGGVTAILGQGGEIMHCGAFDD